MSFLQSIKKMFTGPENPDASPETPQPEPVEEKATEEPAPEPPAPPESTPEAPAETTPDPFAALNQQTPYGEEIMEQRSRYSLLVTQIPKAYNALRSSGVFEGPAADEFLLLCNQAISLRRDILPQLEKGDWIFTHGEGYKRLAMVLEKRGDFQGAAEMCLLALRDGATSDGSQSGMAGRMARMLKKGKIPPTPEMKTYLGKT